jgi:hypothetical protein
MGISIDFKMCSNFPFLGVKLTPGAISNVLHNYLTCDTKYKNVYGLGVGISIDFKISNNFSFLGGWG